MTDKLMYVEGYEASRPIRCRQCGGHVEHGSAAVIDSSSPWLAIHAQCLRKLLPERVEQLYLDMAAAKPRWRSVSSEFRKRLEMLRGEVDHLERFANSNQDRMHPWFRPGRLRSSDAD